jgi:glycosyltransferase 2 family protein
MLEFDGTPPTRRPAAVARAFARIRPYKGTALRIVVSFVTLFVVVKSVSLDKIISMMARADLKWMALALVIFWLAQLASAQRFSYIARTLGSPISFGLSARLHFIGLWFNQVFPSNVGGDVVKVLMLRPTMGLSLAFRTTILDRGSGLIFLLASIIVLLPLYLRVLPETRYTLGLALFAASALATIAVLSWLASPLSRKLTRIPVAHDLIAVFGSLRLFCSGRPLLEQAWTSAIVHFNAIIAYALAGKALGVEASLFDFVLITPLVFLFALLPISFAGWGIRELGSVWLFGLVGLSSEQSSAMSIIFGLMLIVAGIPGLLVMSPRLSTRRSSPADPPEDGPN